MDNIVNDCNGITDSTISNFIGTVNYGAIRAARSIFTRFIIGVLGSNPNEFNNINDGWTRFTEVYTPDMDLR